jgi:hypothetical protein
LKAAALAAPPLGRDREDPARRQHSRAEVDRPPAAGAPTDEDCVADPAEDETDPRPDAELLREQERDQTLDEALRLSPTRVVEARVIGDVVRHCLSQGSAAWSRGSAASTAASPAAM